MENNIKINKTKLIEEYIQLSLDIMSMTKNPEYGRIKSLEFTLEKEGCLEEAKQLLDTEKNKIFNIIIPELADRLYNFVLNWEENRNNYKEIESLKNEIRKYDKGYYIRSLSAQKLLETIKLKNEALPYKIKVIMQIACLDENF